MAQKSGATKGNLSTEAKVKREKNRLRAVFRDLDKNKLKAVEKLIETAAFMAVSLEELQKQINDEGFTSEYQNGENQFGTKKSPAVEIHLAMTKNFTTAIKQLAELAPPERKKKSALQMLRDEG